MHLPADHRRTHAILALGAVLLLALPGCSSPSLVAPVGRPVMQVDRSVGFTTTVHNAATRLSSVPLPAGFVGVVDDHWVPDEHWHEYGALHFMFRRWDGSDRPDDGFTVAMRSAPVAAADESAACADAVRHVEATVAAVGGTPIDLTGAADDCARDMRAMAHAAVSHDEPVRMVTEADSHGLGADGSPYVLHVTLAVLGAPGVQPQLALAFRYSPDFSALATVPQA
jgi:hypothetical protein